MDNLDHALLELAVGTAASMPNMYPSQPSPSASRITHPWYMVLPLRVGLVVPLSNQIQVSIEKFCVRFRESSFSTVTVSSVPSKERAAPNFPVVQVGPLTVPVLLLGLSS